MEPPNSRRQDVADAPNNAATWSASDAVSNPKANVPVVMGAWTVAAERTLPSRTSATPRRSPCQSHPRASWRRPRRTRRRRPALHPGSRARRRWASRRPATQQGHRSWCPPRRRSSQGHLPTRVGRCRVRRLTTSPDAAAAAVQSNRCDYRRSRLRRTRRQPTRRRPERQDGRSTRCAPGHSRYCPGALRPVC